MKMYQYDAVNMTKMATTPIYAKQKHFKTLLLWKFWTVFHETLNVAFWTSTNHSSLNYDPGLTLAYFTASQILL